jgi:hypothetical protein
MIITNIYISNIKSFFRYNNSMSRQKLDINDLNDEEKIKKLLHISGSSFYINFELDPEELMWLKVGIEEGTGFILKRVFIHPNKNDKKNKKQRFVLEIEASLPKNKYLQMNYLADNFTINNSKRRSPNLSEFYEIENFEVIYNTYLGRPRPLKKTV